MTEGVSASRGNGNPDRAFWTGKRVFLTGHTGFKGGWLALWLSRCGAIVQGYALAPPTEPNLFTLARVGDGVSHATGDIRDRAALNQAVATFAPDIVLHLAAQPILRQSYDDPVETYDINVMGTVNLLEAVRQGGTARVTLVITTDKCYENREQIWAYRENDAMGGHDPYSSSKGCAELVTSAYARSFFHDGTRCVASVRAGNVVGGGDWAKDRLMVDIVTAYAQGRSPEIRNPGAVRPWQHVLEPLSGYLAAVEHLWADTPHGPESWNFGPDPDSEVPVGTIVREMDALWGAARDAAYVPDPRRLHEAHLLRLDSSKARIELGWQPRLTLRDTLRMTVDWYKAHAAGADMRAATFDQIAVYERLRQQQPDDRRIAHAAA